VKRRLKEAEVTTKFEPTRVPAECFAEAYETLLPVVRGSRCRRGEQGEEKRMIRRTGT